MLLAFWKYVLVSKIIKAAFKGSLKLKQDNRN